MTEVVVGAATGAEKARVVLVTMVKNESRIIDRLLGSVKPWIDGQVIVDTGSTDNTVELANKFIEASGIPGAVRTIEWTNFGVSRSASVEQAQNWVAEQKDWDASKTFALLLDGDMILPDPVDKVKLYNCTHDSIALKQRGGTLLQDNTRLLRLNRLWTCVGATHEQWDTGGNRTAWPAPIIQDLNDGGCKSDKFERDARLLEEELEKNPNHDRTLFQLAQTQMNLGRHEDAVKMFRRRIDVGCWVEEVQISQLQTGDCQKTLGREAEAVMAWMSGWQKMPQRTECALRLVNQFRLQPHSQFLAMLFLEKIVIMQRGETLVGHPSGNKPLKNDSQLFVTQRDMEYSVWDELAILGFQTDQKRGAYARIDEQTVLSRHDWNVRNHFLGYQKWYDFVLPTVTTRRLRLVSGTEPWANEADGHIWEPFNPSIRKAADGQRQELNLRHANQSTTNAKDFPQRGREGRITTRNVLTTLSKDLLISSETAEVVIPAKFILTPDNHIQGIEDLRLVQGSHEQLALGTGRQFSPSGTNAISKVTQKAEGGHLPNSATALTVPGSIGAPIEGITGLILSWVFFGRKFFPNNNIITGASLLWMFFAIRDRMLNNNRVYPPALTDKVSTPKAEAVAGGPLKIRDVELSLMPLPSGVAVSECQKNWLPFLQKGQPHQIFRINPFEVCDFTGKRVVQWQPPQDSPFTLDGLRGSAAPVPYKGEGGEEQMVITHYSHQSGDGRRYQHRFLTLDGNLKPVRLSCGFRLGHRNIEQVSGCCPTLEGDGYLITQGVNDSEAWVARVTKETVDASLCQELQTGVMRGPQRAKFVEALV